MQTSQSSIVISPNLKDISTNGQGIIELMSFYKNAKTATQREVRFDLTGTATMDANLSALLLALVNKLKREYNKYVFVDFPRHMNVFFRNGCVSHLAGKGNNNQYYDQKESTIPLKTFTMNQEEPFCNYLRDDFFGQRGLSNLTLTTKTILKTHYEEIFSNFQIHAETNYPVFTCGQYFPEQRKLVFSMVDLGIGFLKKIRVQTEGLITTDGKAIEWALQGKNSTKDKLKYGVGGTGLKDLRKYCETNDGSLQVASGSHFLTFVKQKVVQNDLPVPFEGAMINIVFRNL